MLLRFISINSTTSGCSIFTIPIFAPLLFPPCLITCVHLSNNCINDTGPDATDPVEPTWSPSGLSFENEKPVPPPVFCTMA